MRGLDPSEVDYYFNYLRNQWGTKARRLGEGQIITKRRSVQGIWNPFIKYE